MEEEEADAVRLRRNADTLGALLSWRWPLEAAAAAAAAAAARSEAMRLELPVPLPAWPSSSVRSNKAPALCETERANGGGKARMGGATIVAVERSADVCGGSNCGEDGTEPWAPDVGAEAGVSRGDAAREDEADETCDEGADDAADDGGVGPKMMARSVPNSHDGAEP